MKKYIAVITGIVGILLLTVCIRWNTKSAVSVSIIGGADGPTSIFLAGKLSSPAIYTAGTAAVLCLTAAVILWIVYKKKK